MIKIKITYKSGQIEAIQGFYTSIKNYLHKNSQNIKYFDILHGKTKGLNFQLVL